MTGPNRQLISTLYLVADALAEAREGLTWPACESLGFRIDDLRGAIAELQNEAASTD